jgi:hypothetical protein
VVLPLASFARQVALGSRVIEFVDGKAPKVGDKRGILAKEKEAILTFREIGKVPPCNVDYVDHDAKENEIPWLAGELELGLHSHLYANSDFR